MVKPSMKLFCWGVAGVLIALAVLAILITISVLVFKALSSVMSHFGAWIVFILLLFLFGRMLCVLPTFAGSYWFVEKAV
jgi:hypothetical protein